MKQLKLIGLLAVLLLILFAAGCGDDAGVITSSDNVSKDEKKATATPTASIDNGDKGDKTPDNENNTGNTDNKTDDGKNKTKSKLIKEAFYDPSGKYTRYTVSIWFYTDKTMVYVDQYGSGASLASAVFPPDQYLGTMDGYYSEEVGPTNPGTMTVTEENGELHITMVYYDMNDGQKKKERDFGTFVLDRVEER